MGAVWLCLGLGWALAARVSRAEEPRLQRGMPNVCPVLELVLVGHQQPCVQAFSRMVKMWKQGCTGRRWCMGYERRSGYYTVYKQVYRMEHQTVYKCCPGWAQHNSEPGCLHMLCAADTCFNGGKCSKEGPHVCQCPAGFQGPRCQYEKVICSKKNQALATAELAAFLEPSGNSNVVDDSE
ncbi:EGF-like and EMI domain-containing protein 1 [Phasianus colchicus]|uniref:EGF-like and EMI domain-containing protein 1 n=1 Tax=Phasianus colchicus TaxID=9054 RepID=UPI00129EDA62|nr:EGF-like and EMI domain-containing protein 1 [Phasianus colchicus]